MNGLDVMAESDGATNWHEDITMLLAHGLHLKCDRNQPCQHVCNKCFLNQM